METNRTPGSIRECGVFPFRWSQRVDLSIKHTSDLTRIHVFDHTFPQICILYVVYFRALLFSVITWIIYKDYTYTHSDKGLNNGKVYFRINLIFSKYFYKTRDGQLSKIKTVLDIGWFSRIFKHLFNCLCMLAYEAKLIRIIIIKKCTLDEQLVWELY